MVTAEGAQNGFAGDVSLVPVNITTEGDGIYVLSFETDIPVGTCFTVDGLAASSWAIVHARRQGCERVVVVKTKLLSNDDLCPSPFTLNMHAPAERRTVPVAQISFNGRQLGSSRGRSALPQVEHLAFALFATDLRVDAFATKRGERPEQRGQTIRRMWELNEQNWRTEAEARAEHMMQVLRAEP